MNRRLILIVVAVFCLGLLVLAAGCVEYLETPTPPGMVPPPPPSPATSSQRVVPPPQTAQPTTSRVTLQPRENEQGEVVFSPPDGPTVDVNDPAIRQSFARAYKSAQRPRMVFFFNRKLSDQVAQWRGLVRRETTFSQQMDYRTNRDSLRGGHSGSISQSLQVPQGARDRRMNPPEDWMWRFEDQVMQDFLDVGCRVIDRATILRLTSAQADQSMAATTNMYTLETKSLVGKADVLVELLVQRDDSRAWRYNFRAVAKEVRTGQVLASVNSLDFDSALVQQKQEYVATSSGYSKQTTTLFPSMQDVTAYLSTILMKRLTPTIGGVKGGVGQAKPKTRATAATKAESAPAKPRPTASKDRSL